jgi:hypothetical protein
MSRVNQLRPRAALLVTAPAAPMYTGISPLIQPKIKHGSNFNIMQNWGNLSPYASVESHGLPETNGLIPEKCELEEMHWLQRHGARSAHRIRTYGSGQADV